MDYSKLSKDELLRELLSRDRFIEIYEEEKEKELDLAFAWTGNLGHWYWDVQANIVKFNKKKATALGYSDDEIPDNVGFQWFTEKLHPDDYEYVMQNMRDHLYNNSAMYEVEYRIKAKNGDWKWYHDRGKVTRRTDKGEPIFLAGIVFDITEKKEVELKQNKLIEMLSEQMKLQENIYSVIFHDLANPLNSVIGFARILKDEMEHNDCDDTVKRFVDIMYQSSTNAINITKTLINWTKAKRDLGVDRQALDLNSFIFDILEEFDLQIKEKNLTGSVLIPQNTKVVANAAILRIAVRNFLSNSIKYSNQNGELRIAYTGSKLLIEDKGIGMGQEQLEKLFKSVMSPTFGTANEKGHGIGLMLVKELLDQANIAVNVTSTPDFGTKIELSL